MQPKLDIQQVLLISRQVMDVQLLLGNTSQTYYHQHKDFQLEVIGYLHNELSLELRLSNDSPTTLPLFAPAPAPFAAAAAPPLVIATKTAVVSAPVHDAAPSAAVVTLSNPVRLCKLFEKTAKGDERFNEALRSAVRRACFKKDDYIISLLEYHEDDLNVEELLKDLKSWLSSI